MKKTLLLLMLLFTANWLAAQTIFETFDTELPETWTVIDGGTNEGTWAFSDAGYGLNGTNCVDLDTYGSGFGPADDWLITPKFTVVSGEAIMFWIHGSGSYPDNFSVKISKTDTDAASFTITLENETETPGEYTQFIYPLDDIAEISPGEEIYVGIHVASNGSYVDVDNFAVQQLLEEDFESGIPDTWTIIDNGDNVGTWADTLEAGIDGSNAVWLDCYDAESANDGRADDWLITPKITVAAGDIVSFWARSDHDTYKDIIDVKISKAGVAEADFTIPVGSTDEMPLNYNKFQFPLDDVTGVAPGDQIYIALYANSNGSRIFLDDFRVGQYVPPVLVKAASLPDDKIMAWFDIPVNESDITVSDFKLSGSGDITFTSFEIDAEDSKIVYFSGASGTIANDLTTDFFENTNSGDSFEFYAGITPLAYTNLSNTDKINESVLASFQAIVMHKDADGDRVWISDAAGAFNSINTYGGTIATEVEIGDKIIVAGQIDRYKNQSELYPALLLQTISSDNTLFEPTAITGEELDTANVADAAPAENYESVLVKIENFTVAEWDADNQVFICSDDENATHFRVGSLFGIFDGTFDETAMFVNGQFSVIGIVVGRDGDYTVVPRSAADILDENPAPTVSYDVQEVLQGADVYLQSSAVGSVYIILDGEPQTSVEEFNTAVSSQVGATASVDEAGVNVAISTEGLVPGTYYGYAVDQFGKISEKGTNAITISIDDAIDTNLAARFSVYPNPASTFIQVDYSSLDFNVKSMTLQDIQGKIVWQTNQATNNRIAVNQLNNGLYMLKIELENSTVYKKVLIKK